LLLCWALAGSVYLLSGCSEEEPPTVAELLPLGWRVEAFTIDGAPQGTSGLSVSFNASGNYTFNVPNAEVPTSGTWALNSAENAILLNGGANEVIIQQISETELVLIYTQENYKSGTATFRLELVRV